MIVPSRRLLLLALTCLVPAATLAGANVAASWWGTLAVVMLFAVALGDVLISIGLLASLECTLPRSLQAVAQRPTRLRAPCRHRERRDLTVRWALEADPALELDAAPRELTVPADGAATLELELAAPRRGRWPVTALWLEVPSRLGLWSIRERRAVECTVAVHPDLSLDRRSVADLFAYRNVPGTHRFPPLGRGRDFDRLREYVAGDPIEHIHWKATAKRGRPITKLYRVERAQQVLVAIDASRLSRRAVAAEGAPGRSEALLERFVRSGLVLAGAAQHLGDAFGLVTFSDRIERFLRPASGPAHLHACRAALLELEARPVAANYAALFALVRERVRRRSLVVLLTVADDPAVAEELVPSAALVSGEHLVLVVTAGSPDVAPVLSQPVTSPQEAYEGLAGHYVWRRRQDLQRHLERVHARLLAPELSALTPTVVERYLSIKRRQLL